MAAPLGNITPRERSLACLGPHGFHELAYTEWGEPDHEHVVVCVHGLTRNGRDFDLLASRLAGLSRPAYPAQAAAMGQPTPRMDSTDAGWRRRP